MVPILRAAGVPTAAGTEVARSAERFANEAGEWLSAVACARRRLRVGWVAPWLHTDVVVIRDAGVAVR